jgi:hypothetical protein
LLRGLHEAKANIKMQKMGAGGIVSMRLPLPASDLERWQG